MKRRVALLVLPAALMLNTAAVFLILARGLGKEITHRQLLQRVWGHASEEDLHLLRVNISNLRRKIGPDLSRPCYIRTEAGVGYRLRSDI